MKAVNINYLSIIIASLINMLIGYVWYSPKIFGGIWMRLMRINNRNINLFGRVKTTQIHFYFLTSFLTAYILFVFSDYLGTFSIGEGAQLGLWIWLGFVLTSSIHDYIYPKKSKSWNLFFIDNLYILTGLMVMGMILAVWR